MNRFSLLIIFSFISGYPAFLITPKFSDLRKKGDVGDPLFLTAYIEGGKIQEGQAAAEVRIPGVNVTSYTGFLTVNKTFNSNLFFWFFPSEADPKNAPVVLWLQGGPGGSSLFGLFCENGPIFYDATDTFIKRQYYWSQLFNVIYIDNPVGVGFSFTENNAGYATDEVMVGKDLYSALFQFFQLFPDLQKNDFYASGESYAGKYLPAIAYTIHNNNKINKQKINLKGLAIGNGYCDPENMLLYSDYLYQIGLIDSNTRELLKKEEAKAVEEIKQRQYSKANDTLVEILNSIHPNISGYNYLQRNNFDPEGNYSMYLQTKEAKKIIHVGDRKYIPINYMVHDLLTSDFMQSVRPWIEELLENYRIMFYNGQLDIYVAYPLTVNFLKKLNWSGSEEYRTAARKEWMVGGELAGFYKKAKGLTEVLVRDAGHMVPQDQPKWAFDLITRFVQNKFD